MKNNLEILDCTLRDGSYPINYAYSLSDTLAICKVLEIAGIRDIEVGHGMGIGASSAKFGKSLHADLEYIDAAVDAVTKSNIGVFAIAGLATTTQLREAQRAGINFVRVGADVNKLESAIELLECANELGLRSSLNMMKTYAYEKELVLDSLAIVLHTEIDTVSIVDSAGTMLPQQVYEYVEFLKHRIEPKIGFHGHNNLQLAVANSLAAAHAGASVIDATMRGIGRSSGNAQIEVLVPVLRKSGIDIKIDYRQLTNFTDLFFQKPYPKYGIDGIELACGVSGLHSSFLPQLVDFANEQSIDLIDLIDEVTDLSLTDISVSTLNGAARKLKKNKSQAPPQHLKLSHVESHDNLESLSTNIVDLARKFSKKSVMTFSQSSLEKSQIKGITFYGDYIIGHAELRPDELESYLNNNELAFNFLGVDKSLRSKSSHKALSSESFFVFDESQISTLLLSSLIVNLNATNRQVKVKTYGHSNDEIDSVNHLNPVNFVANNDYSHEVTVTLVTKPVLDLETFDLLLRGTDHLVFIRSEDIPIGILLPKDSKVHRLESRKHFDGNIVSLIESLKPSIMTNVIKTLNGVDVVSSGLVAPIGTIVVDDTESPTCILGVASGHGTLLAEEDSATYFSEIQSVTEVLLGIKLKSARSGD